MAYDMKGQGAPIVFIHQAATDRRVWQPQHALLSGQYLTITGDVLGTPRTQVATVERLRAIVMEQDSKTVAYAWATCLSSDVGDHLEEIRTPSLVVAGLHDLFTPPYPAREVAEGLFQVELEIWSATGHFPFWEGFWRFNRRLEAYIRRQLARASSE